MTDLFDRDQTIRTDTLAGLAAQISDRTIDRKALNAAATAIYGGTNASGAWTQRDSFELFEQALTIHLRDIPPIQTFAAIEPLCDLVDALPTHTVRSEEQLQYQQFSTPADIAALMVLLARPRADDIVLEPSAGNGSLLATLPSVKSLHLNELNDKRREGLAMLFPRYFDHRTRRCATYIAPCGLARPDADPDEPAILAVRREGRRSLRRRAPPSLCDCQGRARCAHCRHHA